MREEQCELRCRECRRHVYNGILDMTRRSLTLSRGCLWSEPSSTSQNCTFDCIHMNSHWQSLLTNLKRQNPVSPHSYSRSKMQYFHEQRPLSLLVPDWCYPSPTANTHHMSPYRLRRPPFPSLAVILLSLLQDPRECRANQKISKRFGQLKILSNIAPGAPLLQLCERRCPCPLRVLALKESIVNVLN